MNDKNTRAAIIIIAAAVAIIVAAIIAALIIQRNKTDNSIENSAGETAAADIEENTTESITAENTENSDETEIIPEGEKVELTDELKVNAEKVAEICQQKYDDGYKEGKYISSYSYLYDLDRKVNIEKTDLEDAPENTGNIAIHLFKPKDVHQYMETEPEDDELCVYTAVRTNEGVLISSKNGSGIITAEQYQSLVLSYSPDKNGEPFNPKMGSEEYEAITAAITKATGFSDYEIRHLACNDKYAVFVIGYAPKPDFIKECVMEKENGQWTITYMGVEAKKSAVAEVNEKYPDFDMALYPVYSIYDYVTTYGLTVTAPNTEKMLVEKGLLKEDDVPATYVCGTGNFIYIEGATGTKVLGYKNASNQLEGFNVTDTFNAIAIMREKEDNPPVFIIKMNDDMVKQ